eukprot:gene27845-30884_t
MAGSGFDTHEVFNQPPQFPVVNAIESDPVLIGSIDHALDKTSEAALNAHAAFWGSLEARELARLAVQSPPRLTTHDAQGRRVDSVEHHHAYHALMRRSAEAGLGEPPPLQAAPHLAHAEMLRAVRLFVTAQTEPGHLVAFAGSRAAGALLQGLGSHEVAPWLAGLTARRYDNRALPVEQKAGITLTFGITEKQGGVEPIDTTTTAQPMATGQHRLVGHKWFVSAPMSDAAIMLAEAPGGPSAVLVPRLLADGSANAVRLQRLKDTLGMRAMAIAEIELADAEGLLLGGEGSGPALIGGALEVMRVDATIVAAGQMRSALAH